MYTSGDHVNQRHLGRRKALWLSCSKAELLVQHHRKRSRARRLVCSYVTPIDVVSGIVGPVRPIIIGLSCGHRTLYLY